MTTAPTGIPSSRNSATASTVSCTGISSRRVTTCTRVASECSNSVIEPACEWIGPIRANPATSAPTERNRGIRPVGGASRTMAS